MKIQSLTLLLIGCLFIACGATGTGAGDTTLPGETAAAGSGSQIGPIVDTASLPSGEVSGSISGSCYSPLVDPSEQQLKLAIFAVENGHNPIELPRQYSEKNPIEIYTGFTHQWGFPEPPELQTRLIFQVSSDVGEIATPDLCLRIWTLDGFHDLENDKPSVDMIYNSYGDFQFAGMNEDREDLLPALFKDAQAPGYFDRPDWTAYSILDPHTSPTFVMQAIILQGHLPGGEMQPFASNFIFFKMRHGIP